jgi:hypothetical protein
MTDRSCTNGRANLITLIACLMYDYTTGNPFGILRNWVVMRHKSLVLWRLEWVTLSLERWGVNR